MKVKLDYEKIKAIMKALRARGRWAKRLEKLEKSQGYIEMYPIGSGSYYWTPVKCWIFTRIYYIEKWWVKEWLE
jgi:hypothetical protein